jgi:hypothetical protein
MAMKSRASTSFVMFDVVYEDGTRSSNRKVSASPQFPNKPAVASESS